MNISRDIRIPQIRKIVEALVKKTMFNSTIIYSENNLLFIILEKAAIYKITLNDIGGFLPPISFRYDTILELEEDYFINDIFLLKYASNTANEYYNNIILTNPLVASIQDLRADEEYEKLLQLKIDDGVKFFRLNGNDLNNTYLIPVMSGFPDIAKQDKIGMNVYDLLDGNLFVNMIIYKKKINRYIELGYRIINIV